MMNYLYGYIIAVSSELVRFQKRPNHPGGNKKSIQEGDPTILEVGQQTETTPEVGAEGALIK